ncbi:hypothetical protein FB446DRAFT_845511 [Lentinula raphanica]|nr:hypothetical protein FB446DRAFT_845511 [Lentinula raphanica]
MATVLGVASSIQSLAELTYRSICYIRSVKNAPKEARDVSRELQAMEVYLSDLIGIMSSGCGNDVWMRSLCRLDTDGGSITRSLVLLTRLSHRLQQPRSKWLRLKKRALWPLVGKEEVEELLHSIRRVITLLMAAVQLDGIKLDIAIKEDLNAVREDVKVVRDHTAFVVSLMLKMIHPGGEFDMISRVPRDRNYDNFKDISRWLLEILDPDSNSSFVQAVSRFVYSENLHKSLVRYSNYVIPKCQKTWAKHLPVSHPKQMEIVTFVPEDPDHDSLILRILPIYCTDILLDEGISIAWKTLYEVAIRTGTQPDVLAILMAEELRKIRFFETPTKVNFLVRAKQASVPIPGWTYFEFRAGEVMRVSLLFRDGTCWAETEDSAGHILTSLVEIIDTDAVDPAFLAQFGSDFFGRAHSKPQSSTFTSEHQCPGSLVQLFLERTCGYWWGEHNGGKLHSGKRVTDADLGMEKGPETEDVEPIAKCTKTSSVEPSKFLGRPSDLIAPTSHVGKLFDQMKVVPQKESESDDDHELTDMMEVDQAPKAKGMRIKPLKPTEIYDGTASLRSFQRNMREIIAYLEDGQVPDYRQVEVASRFLKGKAYTFFERTCGDNAGEWTLKRFYKKLYDFAFPIDFRTEQRRKLVNLQQKNRRVHDHVGIFNDLCNTAGTLDERHKVIFLWDSLDSTITKGLLRMGHTPETSVLEDLINDAEKVELIEGVGKSSYSKGDSPGSGPAYHSKDRFGGRLGSQNDRSDPPKKTEAFKPSGSTWSPPRNDHGSSGPRNQRNEKGNASSVKTSHNQQQKPRLLETQKNDYRAAGKCFECGEIGHRSRDCPRRNSVKPDS